MMKTGDRQDGQLAIDIVLTREPIGYTTVELHRNVPARRPKDTADAQERSSAGDTSGRDIN